MGYSKHVVEHAQRSSVCSLDLPDLLALVLNSTEKQRAHVEHVLAEHRLTGDVLNIDVQELLAYGVDEALAHRVTALLELTRRLMIPASAGYLARSPEDIARLVAPVMRQLKVEHMRVLVLDQKCCVVANTLVSQGTVNSSVLRISELFRPAMVRNCPAIAVAHNHPSGNAEPSPDDIATTEKLVKAGKLLEIDVVDHIIVGEGTYTSLRERMHW